MKIIEDFIVVLIHFFNRKGATDFGYERATNLLSLYVMLMIGIVISLGLKLTQLYSKSVFENLTSGTGKFAFMIVLLAFVFLFNFLFKERIINLYEKNLDDSDSLKRKYKNWVWITLGSLPILFIVNIYLIRTLVA